MSGMVDTQLLLSVSMTVMGAPGGFPFVRLNKMFMWLEVFSEGKGPGLGRTEGDKQSNHCPVPFLLLFK